MTNIPKLNANNQIHRQDVKNEDDLLGDLYSEMFGPIFAKVKETPKPANDSPLKQKTSYLKENTTSSKVEKFNPAKDCPEHENEFGYGKEWEEYSYQRKMTFYENIQPSWKSIAASYMPQSYSANAVSSNSTPPVTSSPEMIAEIPLSSPIAPVQRQKVNIEKPELEIMDEAIPLHLDDYYNEHWGITEEEYMRDLKNEIGVSPKEYTRLEQLRLDPYPKFQPKTDDFSVSEAIEIPQNISEDHSPAPTTPSPVKQTATSTTSAPPKQKEKSFFSQCLSNILWFCQIFGFLFRR